MVIHNGVSAKGGTNTNTGDTVPHTVDLERATDYVDSSSSQRTAINAQLSIYESQILHMIADMKDYQMKEHSPNRSRSEVGDSQP